MVTLNDLTLKQTSKIPTSTYKNVVLNDLDGSGFLDGPFASTKTTKNRIKRLDRKFLFQREYMAFKEVMVYFHIDRLQRYVQELGFNNVMNRPIKANIAGSRRDNSYYSPSTKALKFGVGGIDDAEDAEIILHEYGHAILDDQIPGFGESEEAKAIGEAFGDYIAASFFERVKPSVLKLTIGTWDAIGYGESTSTNSVRCLRRLDSKKLYPKDFYHGDIKEHENGEIWSACLWQLRKALGRKKADKLIIAHHFLITRKASFNDAANAMIVVNKKLYTRTSGKKIRNIFVRRGILK